MKLSGMNSAAPQIKSASHSDGVIDVLWSDGNRDRYHCIWLRDACRCESCGDPAIGYRNLRLSALDLGLVPRQLNASADHLAVNWNDGHESRYSAAWLSEHAYDERARRARAFKPRPWDDALRRSPPTCDYGEIIGDDVQLLRMLQRVRDHGICFVKRSPAQAGVVETIARRFGFPQESNFGRVQDLVFDPQKRSIANDIKALKPHTEEPYRASPPGILLFHCIANDQTGAGSSTFVDGFEVAERLRRHDAEGFYALCNNFQTFRRYFVDDVDLIAEFPIISLDEFGNLSGVRINDRVGAAPVIAPQQVEAYYRGLHYLLRQSEDPGLILHLTLKPGDIAIFDNHRVLHGRTDLTIEGQRWLQWVQIERGDFHSSLRILADRLGLARDARPLLRGAYGQPSTGKRI
jgi:alpha-ketoglutarate-dependent taurine dioxygenase